MKRDIYTVTKRSITWTLQTRLMVITLHIFACFDFLLFYFPLELLLMSLGYDTDGLLFDLHGLECDLSLSSFDNSACKDLLYGGSFDIRSFQSSPVVLNSPLLHPQVLDKDEDLFTISTPSHSGSRSSYIEISGWINVSKTVGKPVYSEKATPMFFAHHRKPHTRNPRDCFGIVDLGVVYVQTKVGVVAYAAGMSRGGAFSSCILGKSLEELQGLVLSAPTDNIILEKPVNRDGYANPLFFHSNWSISVAYRDLHMFLALLFSQLRTRVQVYPHDVHVAAIESEISSKLNRNNIRVSQIQEKVDIVVSKVVKAINPCKKKRKREHSLV